jgi:transcription antitermination factor NusG
LTWALATVRANTENSVARALTKRGLPFHIFKYQAKIIRLRKVVTVLRPLFPRYVFVPFDRAWQACRIDNVLGLVCFGESVAAISHVHVENLAKSGTNDVIPIKDATEAARPKYRAGDRIIAIVGLFVGHQGIVQRPLSNGRVRCQFDYMGKRVISDMPPLELCLLQRRVAKKRKRRYRATIQEAAA